MWNTFWLALSSIGTIAVAVVAVMPIVLDKSNLKLHIRCLEEIGSTGRYMMELSITNLGRRVAYLDNIVLQYTDFKPYVTKITENQSELHEGKRIIIKLDSYPFTAISKPKCLFIVDSKSKKWRVKRNEFNGFIRKIEKKNDEKGTTFKEEEKLQKIKKKKYEKKHNE